MLTRQYRTDEEPRIGDVVELFKGAYGDATITEVKGGYVVCERVHAGASLLGQIQIGVERVTVTAETCRGLPVYVTGPSGGIDNRHRS
jgi:hypothetical protein